MSFFTSLLQSVTVDSRDNGEHFVVTDRIRALRTLLRDSDYQLLHEGQLFLLYGKRPLAGQEVVIVSSHIDTVYSHCHFAEEADHYKGTFDNSLTNAAVLYNMLKGRFADNVVIAFTGDEEKDSGGARELLDYFVHRNDCLLRFALVTDVTNEGWTEEVPFSVENDRAIDLFTAHDIAELLSTYLFAYVHQAEPDESWDYGEWQLPCLTLCVPVEGDMHSDAGVRARKQSMPVYCEVLARLANAQAGVALPAAKEGE